MRLTPWACAFALVLPTGVGQADTAGTFPYTATVLQDGSEVRSGPSDNPQMYPTNRLRKGDQVNVVGERPGGWLAITPPLGSFSWIREGAVRPAGRDAWVVNAAPEEQVQVLVGSQLVKDKPTVIGARVGRGCLLKSWGVTMNADDGRWMQVVPPPGEVRFIRAAVVSPPPTASAGSAVAPGPWGSPPLGSPVPGTAPLGAGDKHPLQVQAEQAEKAGRVLDAARLYRDLYREVAKTNPAQGNDALNRAERLERQANSPNGSSYPIAATAGPPVNPGQGGEPLPAGSVRSRPGRLSRIQQPIDGRPAYLLSDHRGMPVVYAVPRPGYGLETFVNKDLELYGPSIYRPELRAYVMIAYRVHLLSR